MECYLGSKHSIINERDCEECDESRKYKRRSEEKGWQWESMTGKDNLKRNVRERDSNVCCVCGSHCFDGTVEHIIDKAKCNEDREDLYLIGCIGNMRYMCHSCNNSKSVAISPKWTLSDSTVSTLKDYHINTYTDHICDLKSSYIDYKEHLFISIYDSNKSLQRRSYFNIVTVIASYVSFCFELLIINNYVTNVDFELYDFNLIVNNMYCSNIPNKQYDIYSESYSEDYDILRKYLQDFNFNYVDKFINSEFFTTWLDSNYKLYKEHIKKFLEKECGYEV